MILHSDLRYVKSEGSSARLFVAVSTSYAIIGSDHGIALVGGSARGRKAVAKMSEVRYDAEAQAIEIDLDGHVVRVAGIAEPRFVRGGAGTAPEIPLWVSAAEAAVLVKMIEYILAKVKITPGSREALDAVLPRAREAAATLESTAAESPTT